MNLTGKIKITEIKAKTKARLFKDVKVGDVLTFTMSLRNTTGHRGSYATYLTVQCNGSVDTFSQSEIVNVLSRCYEVEEVI